MAILTLAQAAQWCGGRIDEKYKDVTFQGACNDTRILQPGQLFLALQGARDGHDFVPQALEKGAAAVLCTHCDGDYPAIVVEDTRLALGEIARNLRRHIGMQVVGVTGSVGKSTTKEMIASLLEGSYRVAKTPANHNNDIGMPMAILAMPEDTQVAVLEMGMNHFGEISYLTHIAQPDVAVIVNVGTMHIANLGSKEGILQAKLEILEGLSSKGVAIFNGDDALLSKQKHLAKFFGVENDNAQYAARNVQESADGISMQVHAGDISFPVSMNLEGMHYVSDAMAAVAVAMELGVAPEDIQKRLWAFRNMQGRQEIFTAGEYTIISDCYNAGPESMEAALQVLSKRPGRHVAVLGDMLELGASTQAEHYKLGRIAAKQVQLLLCYGPSSWRVVNGAITDGMSPSMVRGFTDREQLVKTLKAMARPGDVILFKGSHGMHMELALEAFLKKEA